MAEAVEGGVRSGGAGNTGFDVVNAVKEAVIAGLIAFVLFIGIVGVKVGGASGGVALTWRLQSVIGLAGAVALGHFLFSLAMWSRPHRGTASRPATDTRRIILAALAVLYLIGAFFFVVPGARTLAAGFIGGLITGQAQVSRIRITIDLFAMTTMAVFAITSAAAVVFAAKRAFRRILPGAEAHAGGLAGFRAQLTPGLLLIAVILPILVAGSQQRYAVDIAIQIVTYIMLGWGLNIVVGLAGLLDLGYVAFYAVGAYSYALIATEFGWSFWVCLPLAGCFAALWGIILGFPVLRLRGDYLAIVTLAFGEIIRVVLLNWVSLTNGPDGISRIPRLTFFGLKFSPNDGPGTFHGFFGLEYSSMHRMIFMYYVILALALCVHLISVRLRRLPIGRAWEALREDEVACRSLGINTTTTKLTAFSIGALFGGIAGAFFATRQGFISPESFTFQESALVLAIVVLGGLGSQIGVVLAAIVLIGSAELFRDLQEYRMLIFGASMMAMMIWRPRGIIATRAPTVVLKETKTISGSLVKEGAG